MPQTKGSVKSLHSICTYLGSFPPDVPRLFIRDYSSPGQTVLDPFCGSGTTLLVAREEGRHAIGIDRNPLAVCVASAKAQRVESTASLARLAELEMDFYGSEPIDNDIPKDLYSFFHEFTLLQLGFLREHLNRANPIDNFLLAALLGILHGKRRKHRGSQYLSLDMPNTFSMSPAYVRRYTAENKLSLRPYDAFSGLRAQVLSIEIPDLEDGIVLFRDSCRADSYDDLGPANLILTSPPYLGVLKYGAFNWLRLWLLKEQPRQVDAALASTGSLDRYLNFMLNALDGMARAAAEDAYAILVVGAVRTRRGTLLAAEIVDSIVPLTAWVHQETIDDRIHAADKTTRIWDETRGRASARDQIIVLKAA